MNVRAQANGPLKYFWYAVIVILGISFLIPYYWMVLGAFKPIPELNKVPPELTIQNPTLNNFYDPIGNVPPDHSEGLLQRYPTVPLGFWRFYINSIFVSSSITVISLLVASMAAYVLAKHQFPFRNVLFIIFVASMMIPWQVTIITNFLNVKNLIGLDNYGALILPALPKAFALFFLRQYMLSIPDELREAAKVDGASEVRIWWQIILPLIGPALVAMSIFVFLGEWNNLVWPLIVIQSQELQTLPVILSTQIDTASTAVNLGRAMAASLLVSVPTLVLFIAFQKQFVQGIALTGVKG